MAKLKQLFNKACGLLDIATVQKYIETVTNNAGLSARFDPNIKEPCTNKNTLLIPTFTEDVTQDDLKKLRHWVLHETLHHTKGPDAFDIGERELGFDARHSPLAAMWNIFEDYRIEKAGVKDYRGDRRIIDDGWKQILEGDMKNLEHVLKNAKDDMIKVGAAWYANIKARSEWSPAAVEMEAHFNKCMPKAMRDYVEKLDKSNLIERLNSTSETKKGSRETLNLAKEVYELLWEKDPEQHIKETKEQREQERKQQAKGKGKPGKNGGSGEKTSGVSGSGNGGKVAELGRGDQASGNGDGTDKDGTTDVSRDGEQELSDGSEGPCKLPTGETVSYEVFVHSDHVEAKGPGGSGIQLDYTEHKKKPYSDPYIPCTSVKVSYYRQGKHSHNALKQHEEAGAPSVQARVSNIKRYHASNGVPGVGFGNKVRQLLQIKSQAHYQGGKKKGKVHFKNLYKSGTHIPSYEERVFRQKTESDTLDTCVTVLTDLSGSMEGPKILNAIDSAIILNNSIAKSLRIPVEILGFTEYGADTFIGVVKEYDEPSNDDKIIENFSKAATFMSANADGDAILWTYERLKQREQKRKIMIVISDGSPAASRGGDAYNFTKKVVAQIEGEKKVEIYAVGIMNSNVKDIYSESVVINRPTELEAAILNLIKRSIFK